MAPSSFAGLSHFPVDGSQLPCLWHASGGGQTTSLRPVQMPSWHASRSVQRLSSTQVAPSSLGVSGEQLPVFVLHTPGSWQPSDAVQTTGFMPWQAPSWQTSCWVQALPSSQSTSSTDSQVPGIRAPVGMRVMSLMSAQTSQGPPSQALLQQTPSTQKPLRQSAAQWHSVPLERSSNSSVVASGIPPAPTPPTTSTVPSWSKSPAGSLRGVLNKRASCQTSVVGSYTSTLASGPPAPVPPATSTRPSNSSVAIWPVRAWRMGAAGEKDRVAGSKSSAEARTPSLLPPPAIRT
ncbi:hypothetical protein BE20_01465 [Sorangium cellulosum]|nr:hypothetical protein BE20_01465 [Sorangium cellulosum]